MPRSLVLTGNAVGDVRDYRETWGERHAWDADTVGLFWSFTKQTPFSYHEQSYCGDNGA
jgi:hypothetical protein